MPYLGHVPVAVTVAGAAKGARIVQGETDHVAVTGHDRGVEAERRPDPRSAFGDLEHVRDVALDVPVGQGAAERASSHRHAPNPASLSPESRGSGTKG